MSEICDRRRARPPSAPPASLARLIKQARQNPAVLDVFFEALSAKNARERFGAIKTLRDVSEHAPDLLYRQFDFFVDLLRHENRILKWNAMLILGDLAPVDEERRIDRLIDIYLAPIAGPYLIDAANTMRGATAIAAAKPQLADKIARQILKVEHATYDTPECRNVALGHAINSFERLFPLAVGKAAIQRFVLRQAENPRAGTRKKAEKFLRKWPVHGQTRAGAI